MAKFKFTGNHQSVTIEGIAFVKDQVTELTADQLKTLQASGFWQAYVKSGDLVEVKEEPKSTTAKPPNKTIGKTPNKSVTQQTANKTADDKAQ